jgi:hypothetical protein
MCQKVSFLVSRLYQRARAHPHVCEHIAADVCVHDLNKYEYT